MAGMDSTMVAAKGKLQETPGKGMTSAETMRSVIVATCSSLQVKACHG